MFKQKNNSNKLNNNYKKLRGGGQLKAALKISSIPFRKHCSNGVHPIRLTVSNGVKITLTSLIAALACTGIIYAATTVGTNISTGGTLDVTGAATFTTASSTGIVRFSQINSDTGTISFGNENLTTTGNLTVGATTTLATTTMSGNLTMTGNIKLDDGVTDSPSQIFQDATDETFTCLKKDAGYVECTSTADDGMKILTGNLVVGDGCSAITPDGEDMCIDGDLGADGTVYSADSFIVEKPDSETYVQRSIFGGADSGNSVINSFIGSDTLAAKLVFDRCRTSLKNDLSTCTDLIANDQILEVRLKGQQNGNATPVLHLYGELDAADGTQMGSQWRFKTKNVSDNGAVDAVIIGSDQGLYNISNKSQYEQMSAILNWSKINSGSLDMLNGWFTGCNSITSACSGTETDYSTGAGNQTITYTSISGGQSRQGSTWMLDMDGTDDYITVSDSADLDFTTGSFTINMWVQFLDFSGSVTLMSKWDETTSSPAREWMWHSDSFEKIYVYFLNETSGNLAYARSAVISQGWHMLTVVVDTSSCSTNYDFDTDIKLYVDGVNTLLNDLVYAETLDCAEGMDASATDVLIGAKTGTDAVDAFYSGDIGMDFIDKGVAYSAQAIWDLYMLTRSDYGQ